jgi:SHS2 domain-containing protein
LACQNKIKKMERYRFLDHTADAKFQAFGATLGEAFSNAALAVASVMWDWTKVAKYVRFPVEVRGRDLERLLYNYLEEVLYLLDTRKFLLAGAEDVCIRGKKGEYHLEAYFQGDTDPAKYEIFGEVKAVTYNEMRIEEKAGAACVQVVIDL